MIITQNYPKILVCTVNAWNSKVGDNTFSSLLKDYPKECVASLFIREDEPDSSVCDTYFRISENKVLHSILDRKVKSGHRVMRNNNLTRRKDEVAYSKIYTNKKKMYYTKLFARELVWKLGRWNTPELREFIDEFKPDIIIYEMSRYIHLNNIILHLLEISGAKGVGCFWDDTFTYKQEKKIGYKALRFFQRRNLKRLAQKTASFFAITAKTKREADQTFHIDCTVLTKPITSSGEFNEHEYEYPLKILYTGNLGIGRVDTLELIIDEIKKIPEAEKYFYIDIYTNTVFKQTEIKALNTDISVVHSAVTQSKVFSLQKEADILLFLESLDSNNKIARLSFSTKITDYYAAGKCIFAVGNEDLAPIELFQESDSAVVAVRREDISTCIKKLLDISVVKEYAKKAHLTGISNHSAERIQATFDSEILRLGESR